VVTTAVPEQAERPVEALPGSRYDHLFFSATVAVMLLTVFVGFSRSYYLAGVFGAPLPDLLIHVHAVAFTSWMLLLITQTTLVSSARVDIHRKLGLAGIGLAWVMVPLGFAAATDSLVRQAGPPGRDVKFFYIVPLTAVLMFGTLATAAFRARRDPATHKRLILLATTALMVAAIARWPIAAINRKPLLDSLLSLLFLLALAVYDHWSMRRVHRATLLGGAFLVAVSLARFPVGQTAAWHSFATWVQGLFR